MTIRRRGTGRSEDVETADLGAGTRTRGRRRVERDEQGPSLAAHPVPSPQPDGHGSEVHPARHRFARGRLAAVSVTAAMSVGAWIGLATGMLLGSALGAAIAWFAGAILSWQQDLGLTLGVVRNLLPLGDQAPLLRSISTYWFVVIPAVALISGLVGAAIAGLVAGLVAAAYNLSPRHATVLVEMPAPEGDEVHSAADSPAQPSAADHSPATPADGAAVPGRKGA